MVNAAIERRTPERRDALADLITGRSDVKEIAARLQRSKWAVYKLRRRFEQSVGRDLPRHEKRGRKPKPKPTPAAIAA